MPLAFALRNLEQPVLAVLITGCCAVLALVRAGAARAEPQPRPRGSRRAGAIVLTVVLIAVAAFLVERGDHPIGVRLDSWSDANVVIAGRYHARAGLLDHAGASQLQVVTDRNPPDPFYFYTRYPAGSILINGLWQIAGVRSDRAFRLPPAACSVAALVLWYGLYRRIAGPTAAAVAAIVMATSYGFLAYADNLHFHAYAMLTGVAAMRCYLRAMDPAERQRVRWFLLTALLMFLTACFTWEYHLWMVLFIALYALLFPCSVRRPWLALLALPLVVALALQSAQRRVAFAGLDTDDEGSARWVGFLDDAYRRSLGFQRAGDTPPGLTVGKYPVVVLRHFGTFYGLPPVAALAMLAMLLMRDRRAPWRLRDWPGDVRLAVVLGIAGTGWWLVMIQHTAVHGHVMRHNLAGYAILMALVWIRCWNTARSVDFGGLARAASVVLLVVLSYPQVEGLICNLRLHYQDGFVDDRYRSDAGALDIRQLSKLQDVVPPGAVILTNYRRIPLMRLWSQRPVYLGTTRRFPGDDPANARMMVELSFNHLRELYHERLPPLYYVYRVSARGLEACFQTDPMLRMLLTGRWENGSEAWKEVGPRVTDARKERRDTVLFCPIVAADGDLLVFQMDPAVAVLRQEWQDIGYPTLRQFGTPG